VLLAENGHAGLTQLEGSATPPALILLDIMMPVMDGIKFRSAQLQNPKVSKVPVIIMTADGKAPERAAALQACAFVRKPMDIDYLLKAISNHIRSEAHH
jgi:CheY-like chemotaxis protein